MSTFEGQTVIITGGANGIGSATALAFAREGARVTIADIDQDAGLSLTSEIDSINGESIFVEADVSLVSDCRRVIDETVSTYGGVDVLFNNVGIQPPDSYVNVEHTTEEMWDAILGVNLKSAFLMSKYTIPKIRNRGGGVIINTASVQGLQSMKLVPAYAASKGGILSLTRQMALDYASENIRVLAICPGAIDTKMLRTTASMEGDDTDATVLEWGLTHPIGRIGTGKDIANVVLFLASEKASFMTGEHVCVDGGYMALGAWGNAAGSQEE